jgi:hypothetical protein
MSCVDILGIPLSIFLDFREERTQQIVFPKSHPWIRERKKHGIVFIPKTSHLITQLPLEGCIFFAGTTSVVLIGTPSSAEGKQQPKLCIFS